MPSSNHRTYARFIPREEVGDFTQWKFGSVDGSEPEPPVVVEPEPAIEMAPQFDEEAHCLQMQQASDDAYAEGLSHGQSQAALEWQQRMDDYIAQQGREAAQRMQSVVQTLEASLQEMQQHMAQQVLALACDIARQVVRQELVVNTAALQPIVKEAVSMLVTEGKPATVRLNPEDMESLEPTLREAVAGPGVHWVADAAVSRGGCLVESAGTVVDGRVDKRWQRAIAALGLQSPWQEHMSDEP